MRRIIKSKGIDLKDKSDEKYFIQAQDEIQSGKINSGLMIKCEVKAEGNKEKANSLYIKIRAKQIKENDTPKEKYKSDYFILHYFLGISLALVIFFLLLYFTI